MDPIRSLSIGSQSASRVSLSNGDLLEIMISRTLLIVCYVN